MLGVCKSLPLNASGKSYMTLVEVVMLVLFLKMHFLNPSDSLADSGL